MTELADQKDILIEQQRQTIVCLSKTIDTLLETLKLANKGPIYIPTYPVQPSPPWQIPDITCGGVSAGVTMP